MRARLGHLPFPGEDRAERALRRADSARAAAQARTPLWHPKLRARGPRGPADARETDSRARKGIKESGVQLPKPPAQTKEYGVQLGFPLPYNRARTVRRGLQDANVLGSFGMLTMGRGMGMYTDAALSRPSVRRQLLSAADIV